MVNKSGLHPLGVAVLVEPYEPEAKSSMIVMPATVQERSLMVETRGVVIEVGPWAWHDEPAPRAKPGDKVIFSKFTGAIMQGTKDGKTYRMLNDRDIYCQIED